MKKAKSEQPNELEELLDKYFGGEFFGSGPSGQIMKEAKTALTLYINKEKAKAELVGRIDELKNFEPFFDGDHSKCLDPKTCIGYGNAESDFINEREIRLAQLSQDRSEDDA